MSSYEEMMVFVEELKKQTDHIDWLVSNAGISTYAKYETTALRSGHGS